MFSTDKAFFFEEKPRYKGTAREVAGRKILCIDLASLRKMVYANTQNTLRVYAKWEGIKFSGAG